MLLALVIACKPDPTHMVGLRLPDKEHQQCDTAAGRDTASGDDTSPTDDTGAVDDTGPSDDTGDLPDPSAWYRDADGDGYGDALDEVEAVVAPDGYVSDGTDCDDASASVHPGAVETCDGVDEDCSGRADDMGPGEHCLMDGVLDLVDAGQKYVGITERQWLGLEVSAGADTDGDGHEELLIDDDMYGAWLVLEPAVGTHAIDEAGYLLSVGGDFVNDLNGDGYDEVNGGCLLSGPIDGDRARSDCDAIIVGDGAIGLGGGTSLGDARFAVGGSGTWYDSDLGLWGEDVGAAFVFLGPLSGSVSIDDAVASIRPHVYHEGGFFGHAMCSGDLDGDGVLDLAIGAPGTTSGTLLIGSGLVYILDGPVEGEHQVAEGDGTLADADARVDGNNDTRELGSALSCGGDVDGDGRADLLVGAWMGDDSGAMLYYGPVDGEYEVADADAKVSAGEEGTYLGRDVTSDADLDGDGRADIAVTDYLELEGNLYLYYDALEGIVATASADARIIPEESDDGAIFITGCPDTDSDGVDELLIGAPGNDEGATNAGAAYLVYGGDD